MKFPPGGQYPPGQYAPAPGGYPPQQGGYPPQQGYPPQGYPPAQGYPPQGYPQAGYLGQPAPHHAAHGMMAGVAVAGIAAYGAHHMGHGGGHYPAPGTAHYGHYDHGKHGKGHGKFKQGKGKGKYKQGKFGKNHGGKFKKWK